MRKFEEKIDIIYSKRIMKELSGFVDNELIGNRSSASDAEHRAADYLVSEMKKLGLKNVTKDECPVDKWQYEKGTISFKDKEGNAHTVPLGGYATKADFSQKTFPLVYAGKGTEKDFQGMDVSGKVVLIDIDQMNEWWINFPAYEASSHGAAAVICCNVGGFGQTGDETLVSEDVCGPCGLPVFSIGKKAAGMLKELQEKSVEGVSVCIDARSIIEPDKISYNLWGEILGETDEAIIVINHYDAYYRTVFDDVQGVGWAMGVAKALIDSGYKPYRTIRIVMHASEEWGLINNKYDWAIGAFKQIHRIRPEWQKKGFVVVNMDGFYACAGETKFCIPCCRELYEFVRNSIVPYTDNGKYTFEANLALTSSTEDFSYELAGIPSFVSGAYDGCLADHTVLHSSYSEFETGFDDELFQIIHSMFGKLILDLDQLMVRPVDFTLRAKEIVDTIPDGYTEEKEGFLELAGLAEEIHTGIESINDKMQSVQKTEELKEAAGKSNLALHEVFKYFMQHYLRFDWNDQMLIPHQRYLNNIGLLDEADQRLKEGNAEETIAALEGVDYNYYASYFSKETCEYFVRQVTENTADTWGSGMLENGNQDLYDTLRLLEAEEGLKNTDVIRKSISDAREMQMGYLKTTLEEEWKHLPEITELMKHAIACLSDFSSLLKEG